MKYTLFFWRFVPTIAEPEGEDVSFECNYSSIKELMRDWIKIKKESPARIRGIFDIAREVWL